MEKDFETARKSFFFIFKFSIKFYRCSYDYLEIIEPKSNQSNLIKRQLRTPNHFYNHRFNSDLIKSNQRELNTNLPKRVCGDWSTKLKLLRHVTNEPILGLHFVSDYSHHFGGYRAKVSMENGEI